MSIDINYHVISKQNTTIQERDALINKYINLAAGKNIDDEDLKLLFMYVKGEKELSDIRNVILDNCNKGV